MTDPLDVDDFGSGASYATVISSNDNGNAGVNIADADVVVTDADIADDDIAVADDDMADHDIADDVIDVAVADSNIAEDDDIADDDAEMGDSLEDIAEPTQDLPVAIKSKA